jgi:hypothetical protein
LPEPFHGDPADHLLVATARALPATLITRDTNILGYADAGHLRALACQYQAHEMATDGFVHFFSLAPA